jgi:hypothetical protein
MHDIYSNNADQAQHYGVITCFKSQMIDKTHDICMVIYDGWVVLI